MHVSWRVAGEIGGVATSAINLITTVETMNRNPGGLGCSASHRLLIVRDHWTLEQIPILIGIISTCRTISKVVAVFSRHWSCAPKFEGAHIGAQSQRRCNDFLHGSALPILS